MDAMVCSTGWLGRGRRGAFLSATVVVLAAGCGGRDSAPPLASIPAPLPSLRVGAIHAGDSGWVRLDDLYVDEDGIAWVDADAPLYRKSDPGLAALSPTQRAFVGMASGYLHVSLSRGLGSMAVQRSRPREARWLPARNLGAMVEAIRGGHQEIALPGADTKPAGTTERRVAPSS
jgi:hypothetical protein